MFRVTERRYGANIGGRIEVLGLTAVDLSPVMRAIGAHQLAMNERAFRLQAPDSGAAPWAQLSPKYAARKLAKYGPKPILERTGRLRRSLTSHPSVFQVGPHHLRLESRIKYGKYHQSSRARASSLPRRHLTHMTRYRRTLYRRWIREYASGRGVAS